MIIAMSCVCIKNPYKLNFLFPDVLTTKHFGHLVSAWKKKTRKNVSQLPQRKFIHLWLNSYELHQLHYFTIKEYLNCIFVLNSTCCGVVLEHKSILLTIVSMIVNISSKRKRKCYMKNQSINHSAFHLLKHVNIDDYYYLFLSYY